MSAYDPRAPKATLCWDCRQNIAECPWLHAGRAVDGWETEETEVQCHGVPEASYHVKSCPLYIAPPVKEPCKASYRYGKTKYERLKRAGICTRCRKAPVEPGHVSCSACLAHNRERDRVLAKARRARRHGGEDLI